MWQTDAFTVPYSALNLYEKQRFLFPVSLRPPSFRVWHWFTSRTECCLAWIKKGYRVAFPTQTHNGVFSLPVCSVLAQAVSRGAGTELWCQLGFSCVSIHSQMEVTHVPPQNNHMKMTFLWDYQCVSHMCLSYSSVLLRFSGSTCQRCVRVFNQMCRPSEEGDGHHGHVCGLSLVLL